MFYERDIFQHLVFLGKLFDMTGETSPNRHHQRHQLFDMTSPNKNFDGLPSSEISLQMGLYSDFKDL